MEFQPITESPAKWQDQATIFGNRIKKRHSHLRKWAKRNDISCFRIYDSDIPELPFQVDVYGSYLHVSQILKGQDIEEDQQEAWALLMAEAAARTLGLARDHLFLKARKRQKQSDQYQKLGDEKKSIQVQEGGLTFEVNLSDYLDTGLFLDHRNTRDMVRDLAFGARVLNLFSYTGSFSVYAAAGGAMSTLSVDLSNTYSAWAERNLALNGFVGNLHKCLRMDVLEFLRKAREQKDSFDLIILDPPTFSNSKSMEATLDIQRDHLNLITDCMKILSKRGLLLFSNNFRRFKLDDGRLRKICIWEEITNRTVPEDFLRKRPHRSYLIQHP